VTGVLRKKNLFQDVMNEIHGYGSQMEIDSNQLADNNKEGGAQQDSNYDFYFGSSGPCILEEY
jgi:hypothetical protein